MPTITRKITLFPQGDKAEIDRVYKYLRNGMEFQAQMMNQCISAMYTAKLNKVDNNEWKALKKHYSHKPGSSKGSPYNDPDGKFPIGLPVAGTVPRVCEDKLKKACQDGLMYGKVSLPTFKKDMPLMVHNDYVNLRGSKKKPNGDIKCDSGLYSGQTTLGAIIHAIQNNVDPAFTSQTCSICGQKGIRSSQAVFTCSDPSCKIHSMYQKGINADFNGARNIAMSKELLEETAKIKISTKQHKKPALPVEP